MAAYDRFLSYLFEYDQDTKGANCGFAKIEVRGDTTRIQVTVKDRVQVELLHVCAFYRENEHCVCVPLGRMIINGGNGQFQYVSSGTYLSGSRIMFSQVKGLVLSNPQAPGKAYATVWDDEPFGLSMFKQDNESEEDIHATEMMVPGMWRSGEEAGLFESDRIVVIRKEEMQPEKEIAELETDLTETVEDIATESQEEEEPDNTADVELEYSPEQDEGEIVPDNEEMPYSEIPQEETAWKPDGIEVFWEELCHHFQKIEAFAGNDMICLRAVPADIGRLPRSNWVWGNNGFLMYSYVRYRYIVFARVEKDSFELWLPGTYGKNEEILARMFGFEQFRSMKSMDAADGDFGYWCVPIIMPQKTALYV